MPRTFVCGNARQEKGIPHDVAEQLQEPGTLSHRGAHRRPGVDGMVDDRGSGAEGGHNRGALRFPAIPHSRGGLSGARHVTAGSAKGASAALGTPKRDDGMVLLCCWIGQSFVVDESVAAEIGRQLTLLGFPA